MNSAFLGVLRVLAVLIILLDALRCEPHGRVASADLCFPASNDEKSATLTRNAH
jgi:hypothetical protein